MRTLEFTFRRKYGEGKDKTNYGNSTEMVDKPGKKEPEEIPCFRVKLERTPSSYQELLQDIGGEKNFDKFIDTVYTDGFRKTVQSQIFLKLEKGEELSEAVRSDVIAKVERAAQEFTYSQVIAETLSAKSALDELNSPEMQEIAKNDPAEFARRVQAILASTRGVKAAA